MQKPTGGNEERIAKNKGAMGTEPNLIILKKETLNFYFCFLVSQSGRIARVISTLEKVLYWTIQGVKMKLHKNRVSSQLGQVKI